MIAELLTILLLFVASTSTDEPTTCRRDFRKVGCFTRNLKLFPDLLITDLDPTHKKFGKAIDWGEYAVSLHSLACRCRQKAQGNYSYFGIGMYGECLAGKNNAALEKLMKNAKNSPYSCVNGDFGKCDVDNVKECAGTEDNDFFYELLQGDCSSKIASGNVINLFPSATSLKTNTLVTTVPKLGMIYEVSLEVKPTKFSAGWCNVLHMTVGGNYEVYGSRIPGIWFHPSSPSAKTNKLHICNAVIASRNYCYNTDAFPLNQWIKIRINQVRSDNGYQYSIYLNDKLVHKVKNTRSAYFDNVKVYAADPWYPVQAGYIRNLQIAENCYNNPSQYIPTLSIPTESVLKRNTLVGGISQLCKEYSVSFDVKPTVYASGWHSVLHVTLGGNINVYGDRAPGVWFHPSTAAAATNALHICSPVNSQRNFCYNSKQFPKNKWISVRIEQSKVGADYYYSIHLDGAQAYRLRNTRPLVYYELKVYASDPWYPAQAGSIRNLNINGGSCK